jgi:hypothetical protein
MKMLRIAAAAALSLCIGTAMAAGSTDTPVSAAKPATAVSTGGYAAKTERGQLAQQIVRKWSGYVSEIYGTAPMAWSAAMADTFAQADLSNLRAAAKRQTFEAMNSTLGGRAISDQQAITALAKSDGSKVSVKSIGSALGDLTYTPTQPCRIVDTRLAVGALSPNIARNFVSSGSSFAVQGGSATNCEIPADPSALVLNVTVLGATGGPGFIRVYPYGIGSDAISVNYMAGQRISNEVIVKMTRGQPFDFSAISGFGTHIVVDVAGYFMAPAATTLDCTVVQGGATSVAVGASGDQPPLTCPAGYSATGGGCPFNTSSGLVPIGDAPYPFFNGSAPTGWICRFSNPTAEPQNYFPYTTCCRIPGR